MGRPIKSDGQLNKDFHRKRVESFPVLSFNFITNILKNSQRYFPLLSLIICDKEIQTVLSSRKCFIANNCGMVELRFSMFFRHVLSHFYPLGVYLERQRSPFGLTQLSNDQA